MFSLSIILALYLTCLASAEEKINQNKNLSPLVIVPGLGQSRLEYRFRNEGPSAPFRPIWLEKDLIEQNKSLYLDDLKIFYNPETDEYSSSDHVEVRPQEYGGVNGFTILDPKYPETDRFITLVKNLENIGYSVGTSLFGAPYDFRITGPTNAKKFNVFADLQKLIEKAYEMNNRKKVFVFGHSYGCVLTKHFLSTYVSQQWKKQYIDSFISVNGPYGGVAEGLAFIASYRKWVVPGISVEESYNSAKFSAPIQWLLPNKYGYDIENDVILEIPSLNVKITPKNMSWVFKSTGRLDQLKAMNNVKDLRDQLNPPHVKSYVFICTGTDTEGSDVFGDGDNSVSVQSLRVPHLWVNEQEEPVIIKEYTGADHSGILKDGRFWVEVKKILLGGQENDDNIDNNEKEL
ncbi:MAG: putative phosphatidylcholine-sterol O-acyltransferase [Streblomastix strix]|uniref:Putative phosphatidylcholine-sterol O-acyltransferase n=1 Tax=Streblomastix strix TaxID=222440 RepID=A0A5J4VIY9_9EUKA|nr:MAG: putative phosphatidylcholine-sterol O-acyltransferase [Streblomastix strix]